MADDPKYPKSTPGIAKLFNMTNDNSDNTEPKVPDSIEPENAHHSSFAEKTAPAPADLPIGITPVEQPKEPEPIKDAAIHPQDSKPSVVPTELKPVDDAPGQPTITEAKLKPLPIEESVASSNPVWRLIKTFLPWIAIFGIAIGLYFFYFSDFSFYSLFNSDKMKIETLSDEEVNAELNALKAQLDPEYRKWLGQFFADVTDDSIISMDADVSGNGLTNLEKFLLNLNPKVFSTRGGAGDGQLVIEGINPWTGKPFTEAQKKMVDRYINPELISNRITAAAITRGVTKYSQYVNPDSPYYIDPQTLSQMGSSATPVVNPTQIPTSGNNGEPVLQNPTASPTPTQLDPGEAIDQTKPGLLEIPTNNIVVPIIWTQDVKDFDSDLKKGVVHYPGTPLPGEMGTSYISGHSSGYAWDKSPYKYVFTKLGSVADGTSFTVTVTLKNGKTVKYNYVIERRGEYEANDQAQFISTADSIVALSTCWPVGTVDRRLVLFGKLTQTERN